MIICNSMHDYSSYVSSQLIFVTLVQSPKALSERHQTRAPFRMLELWYSDVAIDQMVWRELWPPQLWAVCLLSLPWTTCGCPGETNCCIVSITGVSFCLLGEYGRSARNTQSLLSFHVLPFLSLPLSVSCGPYRPFHQKQEFSENKWIGTSVMERL